MSEIGEQWSAQTAPVITHAIHEYRICMCSASATPLASNTAQHNGITSGIRIAMTPQLEPDAKAVAAASMNTMAGSVYGDNESPRTEIRYGAVCSTSETSAMAQAMTSNV